MAVGTNPDPKLNFVRYLSKILEFNSVDFAIQIDPYSKIKIFFF